RVDSEHVGAAIKTRAPARLDRHIGQIAVGTVSPVSLAIHDIERGVHVVGPGIEVEVEMIGKGGATIGLVPVGNEAYRRRAGTRSGNDRPGTDARTDERH